MCLLLEFGKQIHAEVVKFGSFSYLFVGSALVDLYAKCGEKRLLTRVFFCKEYITGLWLCPDGVIWQGVFCKTTETEIKFSKLALSTILKCCTNSESPRESRVVHYYGR